MRMQDHPLQSLNYMLVICAIDYRQHPRLEPAKSQEGTALLKISMRGMAAKNRVRSRTNPHPIVNQTTAINLIRFGLKGPKA